MDSYHPEYMKSNLEKETKNQVKIYRTFHQLQL